MTAIASLQAAESAESSRQTAVRRRWILAWLAFLPLVLYRAGVLSEGDTFWQIRIGLLTIAHKAIPAADTFSWTAHGKPYFQNSWGFDVLLAGAYRLGGLQSVAVLCALITLAIVWLALALARALGASPAASAMALFVALPLLAGWLSARPQLLDYVAVLTLTILLQRIGQGTGRLGAAALVGLLIVAWINLHAAALLGVAIAGTSTVLLLLARRVANLRYAGTATAAAALGCLANPYGIGVLHQAGQVQADSSGLITEWAPIDLASPLQDLTLAAGIAALVIAWRRRDLVLTAGLSVCIAGSISAVRFLPFVVILAMPVLAAFASDPPDPVRRYLTSRRVMFQRCGALGIVALIGLAVPSMTHLGEPEPATYPVGLVAKIPYGCRLFTTDLIGSYVILARPDVPVSLDTRNNLYGRLLLSFEERTLHGNGNLSRGLAGAGCVLVPRSYGLAAALDRDPQWQLRASNRLATLYVRR
jgi:hypothetical protein